MKFKEIIKRLTGISTPIFGVSWDPANTERDVAKQIIAFLEDKRVLYAPSEMEVPSHCVHSILEIRKCLTSKISKLEQDSELSKSLRAMRAACRKFMDVVKNKEGGDVVRFGAHPGHWASWEFNGALGALRGVFGIHIAKIAVAYGINVEKELSSILPEDDSE